MNSQLLKAGLVASSMAFLLTACGGSSSSSSSGSSGSGGTPLTGQLLDSPVANIGYRTASQEGTTNDNGEFLYLAGERVRFSIGDVEFPEVPAGETVTPLEMAQEASGDPEADVDHRVAINIARLLQTLDDDGDPENGIRIPPEAIIAARALGSPIIDFDEETTDFEGRSNVLDLVRGALPGENRALKTRDQALEHFREQLGGRGRAPYTGIWIIEEGASRLSMIILLETSRDEGVFYQAEVGDANEPDGLEYGSYRVENNQLFYTREIDNNGDAGTNSLPESSVAFTLSDDRSTLTFTVPDESDITLTRAQSVYGEIRGVWLQERPAGALPDTETQAALFVFTQDKYIGLQPFEERGNTGLEFGSYTFDPENNDLQLTVTTDTSGDSLTSGITINSATVNKNLLTIELQLGDETQEARFRRR